MIRPSIITVHLLFLSFFERTQCNQWGNILTFPSDKDMHHLMFPLMVKHDGCGDGGISFFFSGENTAGP